MYCHVTAQRKLKGSMYVLSVRLVIVKLNELMIADINIRLIAF